jgi:hypothetical protein
MIYEKELEIDELIHLYNCCLNKCCLKIVDDVTSHASLTPRHCQPGHAGGC